ncbi:hypothetical protein [Phenylobacterium sp.]|uniref:hypothetical protein n=1 Tax=Phenylobacterium sp. TaxID=1871053 RepID=UPI0025D31B1E|nr:hypothetical protein [Phenylobacterium sp.]MBX3486058.1 hypothetical protein [Phenylobacterium sp.]
MPATARRGWKVGIVAASLAVHAVLLTLAWIQAPRLRTPIAPSGPPEAIIPVLIVPRTPPPAAAAPGAKPTPVRLHRRPQPFSDQPAPVKPLVTPHAPETPSPKAAPSPGIIRPTIGPTADDALARNARNALKSRLDCNSPTLSRAEREGCMDRFADRFKDEPFQGLGVERGKASGFEAEGRRKEQDYGYKRSAGGGPGTSGSGYDAGKIRQPDKPSTGIGSTAEDLGRVTGADSRRELKVPF